MVPSLSNKIMHLQESFIFQVKDLNLHLGRYLLSQDHWDCCVTHCSTRKVKAFVVSGYRLINTNYRHVKSSTDYPRHWNPRNRKPLIRNMFNIKGCNMPAPEYLLLGFMILFTGRCVAMSQMSSLLKGNSHRRVIRA